MARRDGAVGIAIALRDAWLFEKADEKSGRADQVLSGWAVWCDDPQIQITKMSGHDSMDWKKNQYVHVVTHYGYQGWMCISDLRPCSEEEWRLRQNSGALLLSGTSELSQSSQLLESSEPLAPFFWIRVHRADILSEPRVQGEILETLTRDSIVQLIKRDETDGWSRVRTASETEGYLHTVFLTERRDHERFLMEKFKRTPDFFLKDFFSQRTILLCRPERLQERKKQKVQEIQADVQAWERELRHALTEHALSYLGIQYRWAGKSSQGVDCSGLLFLSYMENGILIYRDAKIMDGFPMRPIGRDELAPGDAIYFPGHVAMYLGDGKFIHATAYKENAGVCINSLNPVDRDYRGDLVNSITGYGSVFVKG